MEKSEIFSWIFLLFIYMENSLAQSSSEVDKHRCKELLMITLINVVLIINTTYFQLCERNSATNYYSLLLMCLLL